MTRPRLLDLFSGAGGAAMGYHRAGFDVVGVDISPQPRYPFEFLMLDAIEVLRTWDLRGFDAIHASPPCQDHMQRKMPGQKEHGTANLLPATRDHLAATGLPWVIENVPGASMRVDYELCGCMVGLPGVMRRRWFETSWHGYTLRPGCNHTEPIINTVRGNGGRGPWSLAHGGRRPTYGDIATAMGIDWMSGAEVTQAIPPAYTEYIGRQLLEHLRAAA